MLVAAMQSMAWGRASGAHTACTGRNGDQNRISGSLPTEIGLLRSLLCLYDPSLCVLCSLRGESDLNGVDGVHNVVTAGSEQVYQ